MIKSGKLYKLKNNNDAKFWFISKDIGDDFYVLRYRPTFINPTNYLFDYQINLSINKHILLYFDFISEDDLNIYRFLYGKVMCEYYGDIDCFLKDWIKI